MLDERTRCAWAGTDPLMVAYHDTEWGVPCHDDRDLFERLMLEANQAGLSWQTILRKREAFRAAYHGFDVDTVARYGDEDAARLLADAGIIRNRLKVRAAVQNAQAVQRVQAEHGSLDAYLWSFVDGQPIVSRPSGMGDVPARTPLSDTISKELKRRGFTFVGTTIVYAFMQSVGMVNDHLATCTVVDGPAA